MFVDICTAEKSEEKFLERSNQLGTDALCFVKKSKKDKEFLEYDNKKAALNVLGEKSNITKKNTYLFVTNSRQKSFHHPDLGFSHVLLKEIKRLGSILILSFADFSEILERPEAFQKYLLLAKLIDKYKVPVALASFAATPQKLCDKESLKSFGNQIGLKQRTFKDAIDGLYGFFQDLNP